MSHLVIARWLGVGALAAILALSGAPAAAPGPHIAGLKAFLFNSRTGDLSTDVLTTPDALHNVVAGPFASVATLVVVTVDFDAGMPVSPGTRVRLVATTTGRPARVMLDRTARIGPAAADGTTRIGFWLDDTGCTPVSLRATLVGRPQANGGSAQLPFHCGE